MDGRTGRVALALLAVVVLAAAGGASAEPRASTPAHAEATAVHVKFRAGSQVRLRKGELRSLAGVDLAAVSATLRRFPARRIERLFSQPERALERDLDQLERRSGRPLPDLNLWFRIRLASETTATGLAAALEALPTVEIAYVEPPPAPVPVTPSFVSLQGYRSPAPNGIDAAATSALPGARGTGVKIVDVEYSWNATHEDLTKAVGGLIPNGIPTDFFNNRNHGTAVLSEIVGDDNAFGVTGLVPDATIAMVNALDNNVYDLADAINIARLNMSAGDVMLLEQQAPGYVGACGVSQVGCVPVEWIPAYYAAITTATAAGIIVVEAAGNGSQDLDQAFYGTPFPAGRADSGAIIVGAGGAPGCGSTPARSRLSFSTYGSRVNLQGWGECVTTAGYGSLQGGVENAWYTSGFGGTSSASPIVASAAASLSGARKAASPGTPLTSIEARTILTSTGTAQDTASPGVLTGNIGPLPNLAAALAIVNAGLGTFADVPPSNPFYDDIEQLFDLGITTGCGTNGVGALIFCPAQPVPRQQMAAFLVRAKGLTQLTPATPTFADVPTSNPFFGYIERLKEQGITTGCNPPANDLFCPLQNVPRQQMAAFLVRAKGLTQLTPATPTFADVPASNPFYGWIERLYEQGITTGCGTNGAGQKLYCPGDDVPRQQMAAFLVRAFAP